jgi:anti-sigma B factor antagonist
MVIGQRVVGDVVEMKLGGRLVLGDGVGSLGEALAPLLESGERRFVLDLGGITYLDSAGLGELVAARMLVTRAGGRIRLANLTRHVAELLAITRIQTLFESE